MGGQGARRALMAWQGEVEAGHGSHAKDLDQVPEEHIRVHHHSLGMGPLRLPWQVPMPVNKLFQLPEPSNNILF